LFSSISLFAQFGGGARTKANPYRIYTHKQMEELADSVNRNIPNSPLTPYNWSYGKYFILMNNIKDSVRTTIGNYGYTFQGNFDGQRYKITLAIKSDSNNNRYTCYGLFGIVSAIDRVFAIP
jgi:hypothetical protein